MPAGCEFICKNQACKCLGCGFSITAPWPMCRIELVLNAPNVKKLPDFRQHLIDLKNEGRKYACITFPNISRLEVCGYRISMWSKDAQCIWKYDAMIQNPDESLEETIKSANIPEKCPKTNCDLWDFQQTVKNGVLCPHCGIFLQQDRWFTNED